MAIFRTRSTAPRLTTIFGWLVALPALLMPIFFLPVTPDALEFNKVALLTLLVLAAAVVWFVRLSQTRTLTAISGPFLPLLGIFLIVAVVSWGFSAYRYFGLVGIAGFYNHPLAHLLLLGAYLFLLTQAGEGIMLRILRLLLIGSGLVFLYNIFKLFGLELLPFAAAKASTFNLLTNSSGALALLAALAATVGLHLSLGPESRVWRIVPGCVAVVAFSLLALLDHQLGWIGIMVGMFVLVLGRLPRTKQASPVVPIMLGVVIAASLILFILPAQRFTKVAAPADILLDGRTSTRITSAVLRRDPVFGSGPESFPYAFTSYRPLEYNETAFWNLRFLKAGNEFNQLLVSLGLVGTITFFAFLIMLGVPMLHRLLEPRTPAQREWLPGVAAAWFLLVASLFFSPLSFLTTFLLFLFSALAILLVRTGADRTVRIEGNRQSALMFSFSILIVAVAGILFFGGRLWLAEASYASAVKGLDRTEQIDTVRAKLMRAVNLNGREAKYWFTLAQVDLIRAQIAAGQAEPDAQAVQAAMTQASQAIGGAVAANGAYPDSYEQVADLTGFAQQIGGSDLTNVILDAYNRAAALEPRNPIHYLHAGQVELGRAQTFQAQSAQTEDDATKKTLTDQQTEALNRAEAFFKHAKSLRSFFPPGDLGLAIVLELRGKPDQAVAAMQQILAVAPNDVDTWLELGRVLLNQKKDDDALLAFQQATTLAPQSAVGFLNIAQIYEAQGKKAEARAAYEQVNKLAPGTAQIEQKLEELKPS